MISSSECIGALSPSAREITVQVVLELVAAAALARRISSSPATATGSITSAPRLRSSPSAPLEHRVDLRVERRRVVGLMQHAEARAFEAVARAAPPRSCARHVTAAAAVTGSVGSWPAITCSTAAVSATVRVTAPAMSAREVQRHDAARG